MQPSETCVTTKTLKHRMSWSLGIVDLMYVCKCGPRKACAVCTSKSGSTLTTLINFCEHEVSSTQKSKISGKCCPAWPVQTKQDYLG